MGEREPQEVSVHDKTVADTSSETAARSKIARGSTIGRYIVVSRIGAGGMGEVFLAFDPDLDRKVALKLVKPTGADTAKVESARGRLVREGQAMAKLSHPNVIPVFDVGTFGRNVYIAMEFVEGEDLRGWLDDGERSWRDILGHFLAAAAGLQAAHDAGIVHRDFKADNALLGADGRVRVIDFGVAHKASDSVPASSSSAALKRAIGDSPAVATKTGALMGTPLYMAPEQFLGDPVDERTDQFNFCASLFEALYGKPPFEGDTITKLMIKVTNGELREIPETSDVPRWLGEALRKGLSPERAERYGSMSELVEAITPPEPRRYVVPVLFGGLAVMAIVAVVLASRSSSKPPEACKGLDAPMQRVWSDARQTKVKAAILGSKLSYADAAWTRVDKTIDAYAAAWIRDRTEACRATAVRKEQPAEMLVRRMACYDQRLRELDAVVTVIETADARVVENSAQAASNLSPVAMCANQTRVLAIEDDQVPPSQRKLVDALLDDLATVKALQAAGKYRKGLGLATKVYRRATELSWRRGIARAAFWMGDLESRLGKYADAEEHLFESVRIASESDDHATEANAWVDLVHVVGVSLERHAQGARWAKHAAVAIDRGGGDRVLQGRLHFAVGHIQSRKLDHARALVEYKTSGALLARVLGDDHYLVAGSVGAQGSMLRKLGRVAEAATTLKRAAAMTERSIGDKHPHLAVIQNNLGNALANLGKYDEAHVAYKRAIAIKAAALGAEHLGVSSPLINRGRLLDRQGKYVGAEALYKRALAIRQRHLKDTHPRVVSVLQYLSSLRWRQGRFAEELALHNQVVTAYAAHYGTKSWQTASVRGSRCEVLRRHRKFALAGADCRAALAKLRGAKLEGYRATALTNAAALALDTGATADSQMVTELRLALSIRLRRKARAQFVAYTRFVLARALWTRPADRPEARKLAHNALQAVAALLPGDAHRQHEIQTWLNRHPLP